MQLDKLRYSLTNHRESYSLISSYENFKLLVHPSIDNNNLLNRLEDDIKLLPDIQPTTDKTEIKFYRYDYNEHVYLKDELLAFILASINQDWDIIKGIDITTGKIHFWLKNSDIVYDPSLAVITKEDIFSKKYKRLKEIKNEDVENYLRENNNLYKFYQKGLLKKINTKGNSSFSIHFVSEIIKKFNKNINKQYELDDEKIKELKEFFSHDNFIEFRQALTQKRISYLQSSNIAVHPSIDESILEVIEKAAKNIYELMKKEYNMHVDYHNRTIGNCYALSIMFNLYNGDFKLIQGGIPYERTELGITTKHFYQHSWLEKDDIVYDPALRIITPKDLYYTFVQKQDEYSKEDTENILRRIGFNLTHFRDFLSGIQIGNDESIMYRCLVNKVDSLEFKEEGEKLISYVKSSKR